MTEHIRVIVEGDTDEPFARHLVKAAGHDVTAVIPMRGHGEIDKNVGRWSRPSNVRPMLILRDLDPDLGKGCAPALVRHLVGSGPHAPMTVFRIAERELEAWMLADRDALANYLDVDVAAFPLSPDDEEDPKRTLVNICRQSASRRIRDGMVPSQDSGRTVGRQFTGFVLGFGRAHWDPQRARRRSSSLERAMLALENL
jgi:hypothetical protein